MRNIPGYFVAIFALMFAGSALAVIKIPPKLPQELVVDFAGTLTPEQKKELSTRLHAYYEKTSNVVVVVTIPSLEETGKPTGHDWNMKLFDTWKPGSAEKDNGVIISVSGKSPPFKMRVNPGRGLTPFLTDAFLRRMEDTAVLPTLNAPNGYYAGINLALDRIETKVGSEFGITDVVKRHPSPVILVLILVVGGVLALFLGFLSPWFSGVVGGLGGGLLGAVAGISVIGAILVGAVLGLVVGAISKGVYSGDGLGEVFGDIAIILGRVMIVAVSVAVGGDADGGGFGDL